jgi:hypothetical protein
MSTLLFFQTGLHPAPRTTGRGEWLRTSRCRTACIAGQTEFPPSSGSQRPSRGAGVGAIALGLAMLDRAKRALHTLIHRRHLTPSCGGHTPTAERTLYPARMFAESLTPRPELENGQDPQRTLKLLRSGSPTCASGPRAEVSRAVGSSPSQIMRSSNMVSIACCCFRSSASNVR